MTGDNYEDEQNNVFIAVGRNIFKHISFSGRQFYSIEEGTSSDYNFTLQEADSEGNLTTKYYKIVLNPAEFSTSSSITWEPAEAAGENTIEVQLPNNQTQYFKYTYTKPDNYTETSERIDDTLASANVTNVLFSDINHISSQVGGAIYNTQDNSSINIIADFIGNSAGNGGVAIYNATNASIASITGDFIENSSSGNGSVIYNDSGIIGNITGDFIGNSSSGNGGVVYNEYNSSIGNITGDFIENSSSGNGGAVYNNSGTMGNITGDFIGNSSSLGYGGAIVNLGTMGVLPEIS